MTLPFIYALREPGTGTVRYVGKADNPRARFYQHLMDRTETRKARWIASLAAPPTMVVLEECDADEWRRCEARWIERLRARGVDLVNDTPGFGVMARLRADQRYVT